jgi:dolichyl-phosphate-mannose-protein mannosyltransferase
LAAVTFAILKLQINASDRIVSTLWWILFVLALGVVTAIRIRLLAFPLERDEGEYAYAGQLLLHGVPPYQLAYNMKFPGTYAAYALIMFIFGQSTVGVHLGLLIVNLATVALIFFLGRRLLNWTAGIAAGSIYAVLSVSPWIDGFSAHATHFVMLAALGGALLLLRAVERQSWKILFGSGILFGFAVLMKQPGVCFAVFGAFYLLYCNGSSRAGLKRGVRALAVFGAGVLTPFLVACLLLWRAGVFDRFWFWTIQYAREYGGLVSFRQGMEILREQIVSVIGAGWALWGLAAIGLVISAMAVKERRSGSFLVGWLVASVLGLSAGLYFREHYFVFVLPSISLLAATAVAHPAFSLAQARAGRVLSPLVLSFALALPLFADRQLFFTLDPAAACRSIYYPNPFPECIRIADFVRKRTKPDDQIAVLGSEPEIYFYADRRSATGYIYTYPLMEPHKYAAQMQREMMREIEQRNPEFVIFVAVSVSWLVGSESDRSIFDWAHEYCAKNYAPVGLVTLSEKGSEYYFSGVLPSFDSTQPYILIYQRKA